MGVTYDKRPAMTSLTIAVGAVTLALTVWISQAEVAFYSDQAWEAVQLVTFAPSEIWSGEAATDTWIGQIV